MSESLKLDQPATGKAVAKAFGCGETAMTASKAAGYQFEFGTKTTLRHYMNWRREHPEFRVTSYVNAHSKKNGKNGASAKGHSQRQHGRRAGNVRNHGGR